MIIFPFSQLNFFNFSYKRVIKWILLTRAGQTNPFFEPLEEKKLGTIFILFV